MPGAYEENAVVISLNAAADHSDDNAGLNRFVIASTTVDGEFVLAGSGEDTIGVLTNKPTEGSPGRIAIGGIVPLELGETVTTGARLASGANGVAVDADSDTPRAVALAGGDEGEIIPALVILA